MKIRLRRAWFLSVAWGCHMPFLGVGPERFGNGVIVRVSLWPMRYGFHVVWWKELAHRPARPLEVIDAHPSQNRIVLT